MSFSSPTCYLGVVLADADWEGAPGGRQWVIRERWTLEVAPLAAGGWTWRLVEEEGSRAEAVNCSGEVTREQAADAEVVAKQHVIAAWQHASPSQVP